MTPDVVVAAAALQRHEEAAVAALREAIREARAKGRVYTGELRVGNARVRIEVVDLAVTVVQCQHCGHDFFVEHIVGTPPPVVCCGPCRMALGEATA